MSSNKYTAARVQTMLAVEDDTVIAYGYTLDRYTVEIYFREGQLVRDDYYDQFSPDRKSRSSPFFEADYFSDNIKRWYARSVHPELETLMNTFGRPLNTVAGGSRHVWRTDLTTTETTREDQNRSGCCG